MPTEANDLLTELSARLPELEWKISGLGSYFSGHSLPRGLFKYSIEPTGAACVAEIKADIDALYQQKNERSAFYLAERIRQKINVLVALCNIHSRKNKPEEKAFFGVKMLATRQQWVKNLEADIRILERQQQAMIQTLGQRSRGQDAAVILRLQAELGEVERRLTLARETLNHAVS